ncbi:MAG: membrane protein insertase YidC [Acidimicrobiales bacterium]
MFDPFFNAIAGLLAWFYELPLVGGSYFWAITLLTLTVMLVLTPLTVKGTRSMMTMTAMAPEMKKIQQEFADDRERMNQELLAFYKENKINPVGGCLPLLLQMPVFIILYQVLYGMTRRGDDGLFDPKYLDQFPDSDLYQALSASDQMLSVGLDLSRSALVALQESLGAGIPYVILIIAVAGSAFLQQKQMSGRNPNAEMPPQQKILLRVLPIFFAAISFNFAAGLVVYFLVSNVYRILQNGVISMKLYNISPLTALLGIGAHASVDGPAPLAGSAGSKDTGSKKDGPAADKKGTASRKATPPARKSSPPARGKGTSGAKAGGANKNGQRPPSGRVTPPKSAGGAPAPRRRKKKRT